MRPLIRYPGDKTNRVRMLKERAVGGDFISNEQSTRRGRSATAAGGWCCLAHPPTEYHGETSGRRGKEQNAQGF